MQPDFAKQAVRYLLITVWIDAARAAAVDVNVNASVQGTDALVDSIVDGAVTLADAYESKLDKIGAPKIFYLDQQMHSLNSVITQYTLSNSSNPLREAHEMFHRNSVKLLRTRTKLKSLADTTIYDCEDVVTYLDDFWEAAEHENWDLAANNLAEAADVFHGLMKETDAQLNDGYKEYAVIEEDFSKLGNQVTYFAQGIGQTKQMHLRQAEKFARDSHPCRNWGIFSFVCAPLDSLLRQHVSVYEKAVDAMVSVLDIAQKLATELQAEIKTKSGSMRQEVRHVISWLVNSEQISRRLPPGSIRRLAEKVGKFTVLRRAVRRLADCARTYRDEVNRQLDGGVKK